MHQHLKILGVLYLITGALYLLGALVVATAMAGTGLITQDWGVFALLSGVGMAIALVLGVLGLPGLIVGWGLVQHRSWVRVPALILAALNLLNFPVGTLLGGYTFWVLFQPESERLLGAGGRRADVTW